MARATLPYPSYANATSTKSNKRSCPADRKQTTLFKYHEKTSSPSGSSSKTFVDVTPESQGIKIYTKEEIEASSGLKKTYLLFWNGMIRPINCAKTRVCVKK